MGHTPSRVGGSLYHLVPLMVRQVQQATKENQARLSSFQKEKQLLAVRQATQYQTQDKESLRVLNEYALVLLCLPSSGPLVC